MMYVYPTKDSDTSLPLTIDLLGIMHDQEPVNRPKGLPLYQWFYCESGTGEVIIEGRKSVLKTGQGVLIYPGIEHSYHAINGPWIVSFIGFGGSTCLDILRTLHMQESGIYHFTQKNPFYRFEEQILAVEHLPKHEQRQRLSVVCYDFLMTLADNIRYIDEGIDATENMAVKTIVNYLEEHYRERITIDDLAKAASLSASYMQSLFKAETGRTTMQYLTTIRITHARRDLVQYPERPIYQIATDCGFEDASYFGYVFKKETGMTPARFRKI